MEPTDPISAVHVAPAKRYRAVAVLFCDAFDEGGLAYLLRAPTPQLWGHRTDGVRGGPPFGAA